MNMNMFSHHIVIMIAVTIVASVHVTSPEFTFTTTSNSSARNFLDVDATPVDPPDDYGHSSSSPRFRFDNVSSASTPSCTNEGDLSMLIVGALVSCTFLVAGSIGNVCVVVVVARTKPLRRHPTNWYLASVALADFMILWSAAFPTVLEYRTSAGEWVLGGWAGCSLAIFFQYLGINASSIFIAAFSLERYVAICHPMKAVVLCTLSRAKKIVALVWLFSSIYCSPWFFLTTVVPMCGRSDEQRVECMFKLERSHYATYYMMDFVIFYVFPLVSTCVLYILIGRSIAASRETEAGPPVLHQDRGYGQPRWSKNFKSRVQVVKMLAVVVAVFAVSWLPYRVFVVYNSFARARFTSPWFLTFCRLSIYFNSTINPVLYNVMSAKFRKAFRQLFTCSR